MTTRKPEDKNIDPAIQQMIVKGQQDGVTVCYDRYEAMQPQCGFGELGICCRNCLQGPCRIDPFGGEPSHGICGADADTIVARNLLRTSAGGAATHCDHAFETIEMLLLATEGKAPYQITDVDKLKAVAERVGVKTSGKSKERIAHDLAMKAYADYSPSRENKPLSWLESSVPPERVETWKKVGILPTDGDLEIRRAMHETSNGVDHDPVKLSLQCAKMGLIDAYSGLKLGTDFQDIVFGTPRPVKTSANLGVLQEDKVNIAVHGHIPFLSEKIVEWARKLEPEAKKAGAKGIQLCGICCTGNEVLMRHGVPSAGNYLTQEFAVITGALDAIVVDVQCVMPSLVDVANCYHTKVITTHEIGGMRGATHIPFAAETADEDAQKIVRLAIEAFKNRIPEKVQIPNVKTEMWGGFSVEAIIEALAALDAKDPLKPLVDNIKAGNIRGLVGMVGCDNTRFKDGGISVPLAEELIKEGCLIYVGGCCAHALGRAGLMCPDAAAGASDGLRAVLQAIGDANKLGGPLPPVLHMGSCVDNSRVGDLLVAVANYLGVRIQDLPAAATAPELMHEKAVSIGEWAVDLGLLTHIGMAPFCGGSGLVTKILTDDLEGLVGGKFYVASDPHVAAQTILAHIDKKRAALGI